MRGSISDVRQVVVVQRDRVFGHYGLGTVCQQAEIGMFLGKVTSGMMASWNWAEYFHPTGFLEGSFFLRIASQKCGQDQKKCGRPFQDGSFQSFREIKPGNRGFVIPVAPADYFKRTIFLDTANPGASSR